MRAFALVSVAASVLVLLSGCMPYNDPDYPVGYDMSSPPIINPVYDDRETQQKKMDSDRKVSEQDCTKPIDPTQGNLRCK